ncbi:MAG TPA: PQQ-binding-like beta-propeller repeat protein [Pirellulales bacterium]
MTSHRSGRMLLVFVLTVPVICQAQDAWPRFRGPNGQGQSEAATIPTTFAESDYNWKTEFPGIGHSSPVVWGNKVFITSADPDSATVHVLAFNTADGKKLWQRDYPSTTYHLHTQNNYASSTPALDADRIYVAWANPEEITLLALDHDGHDVWRKNLGPYKSEHGFGTSPIVVDDKVIITNDQEGENRSLIAVDAKTGADRWRIPRRFADNRQNASYATPCVMETPAGRELIVCSWAHGISSHDLATGVENWESQVFKLRPVASPVLVDGLILGSCGEGGGNNTMIALKPGSKDGRAPELAFPAIDRSSAPYIPTICVAGDLAFLWTDKGIVTCLDVTSGKQLWRQRVGGTFFSSPVRVQNRIYNISADGEVVVLAATPEYKLLARNGLGEGTQATPAIAGGKMYLRTLSHLISIGGN